MPNENKPLDNIKAFLYKLGDYLLDPRTYGMIISILLGLRSLGFIETEIDQAAVSNALKVVADLVIAVANLIAVIIPVITWLNGISIRPPRGLQPWLDVIRGVQETPKDVEIAVTVDAPGTTVGPVG